MNGPFEPPSDVRELAAMHFSMFQGYVQAGFTEPQALYLMGQWITGGLTNRNDS